MKQPAVASSRIEGRDKMRKLLYPILLLPLLTEGSTTLHLTSDSADLTVEMNQNSSAPVKFHIIGNGPGMNDLPSVCEVSGEADFWAGADSGLSWIYFSPDRKSMVLLKGRTDSKWTVLSLLPDGVCGLGAENSLDGVYHRVEK